MSDATSGQRGPSSDQASRTRVRAENQEGLTLLRLLNSVLRHRRTMVVVPVAVAFVIIGLTLIQPAEYTSTATFTPESGERRASDLASVAARFGVSVPIRQGSQSPQFYADLLESREVLRETVLTQYPLEAADTAAARGDLISWMDVEAETRPVAVERAIESLRQLLRVSTESETGVIRFSVTTRWRNVSQDIAERMLALVNEFNLQTRRSQASAERTFIEERMHEARRELLAAEDSLESFLERNRSYQQSPQLRFEYERFQRRVSLRQQVFTSLSQSLEQAKIDEVRNTPVITIVEPPELPARPDSSQWLLRGLLGLVVGGMLAVLGIFTREVLVTHRVREPDQYAEFTRLKKEMLHEARTIWKGLREPWRLWRD